MAKQELNSKTYRLQIFDNLVTDEKYGMPLVPQYKGEIPKELQAFNKAIVKRNYDNRFISI